MILLIVLLNIFMGGGKCLNIGFFESEMWFWRCDLSARIIYVRLKPHLQKILFVMFNIIVMLSTSVAFHLAIAANVAISRQRIP